MVPLTLDPRHALPEFLEGNGLAMYWETLARWIPRRARRDARELGVPLVVLQAGDECNSLDKDAYSRLLNVANIYNTGKSMACSLCMLECVYVLQVSSMADMASSKGRRRP